MKVAYSDFTITNFIISLTGITNFPDNYWVMVPFVIEDTKGTRKILLEQIKGIDIKLALQKSYSHYAGKFPKSKFVVNDKTQFNWNEILSLMSYKLNVCLLFYKIPSSLVVNYKLIPGIRISQTEGLCLHYYFNKDYKY